MSTTSPAGTASGYRSSFLYRIFFAPDALEDRKLSTPVKLVLILLLFVLTRLVTIYGFHYREVDWMSGESDPQGYVATANYVAQHGCMPTEDKQIYRQFAGLSLLMIPVSWVTGNMETAGYVVVMLSGIGCLFFMQYLFDDFRLTVIFTVFMPAWIMSTSTIFSEAPTMLCFLTGFWAVRDLRERPGLFYLAILVAGYALVIRQTSFLFLMPVLFLLAWRFPGGNLRRAIGTCAVASVPILGYLAWNWFTIHQLFPQAKLHHEELLHLVQEKIETDHADPARYSRTMFDVPFHSFVAGITDPTERLGKRISAMGIVGTTIAALAALLLTAWKYRGTPRGLIAAAFGIALLFHLLFHVSLGGNFGYRWLDRHMSPLSPIIDWVLFYHRPLRWIWIILLIIGGVVFAANTGIGVRGFGPFK